MDTQQQLTAPRSSFVTVLAWVFIVLAGFATFISLMQNVMVNVVFPLDEMQKAMENAPPNTPWFAKLMVQNLRVFVAGFLALCILVLVTSVALLRRKKWARLTFLCLLALGIVWNLGTTVYTVQLLGAASEMPDAPAHIRAEFERFHLFFSVAMCVMAIGISGVFGWLLWKLQSKPIAAEFQ